MVISRVSFRLYCDPCDSFLVGEEDPIGYGSNEDAMVRQLVAKKKEGHEIVLEARFREEVSSAITR